MPEVLFPVSDLSRIPMTAMGHVTCVTYILTLGQLSQLDGIYDISTLFYLSIDIKYRRSFKVECRSDGTLRAHDRPHYRLVNAHEDKSDYLATVLGHAFGSAPA